GLYTRFPRPDYAMGLHANAGLAAGQIGYVEGYALANVDMVDSSVFGIGGHGAYPHTTKDPIVLAAQIINALQTLVSREISPLDPAVVTVGSIHGGTKHNIIPDQVDMQLTVRSYSDENRKTLLEGIKRIAHAQALVMGLPEDKLPLIRVRDEFTPALYNDPPLTKRVTKVLKAKLGDDRVVEVKPVMGGEDFSEYGRVEPKVPSFFFWLGAIDPVIIKAAEDKGEILPSLHSAYFAPLPEMTILTGVEAMTEAAMDLFNN
ncbi:MAG: amidohydrolase, partial [Planctomycetota bacterium]